MPRPYNKLYSPSDPDDNYFADNATGAIWNLTNTNTPDNLAHKITVKNNSGTDYSGLTITILGIDQDGAIQSENIIGPGSNGTVTTLYYYKSINNIAPNSSI